MRFGSLLGVCVVALIFLSPSDAWAGRLHIHPVTLADMLRHGFIVLGTVMSVLKDKGRPAVTARVKQIFCSPDNATRAVAAGKVGDEHTYPIYQGIVWKDANISPIDKRVPGALHVTMLAPGQDIFIIPTQGAFEVLPASETMLAKVALFFEKDALARYVDTAAPERVFADLVDADLKEPALQAIAKRKMLDAALFLTLSDNTLFDVGAKLCTVLSADDLNAWFLGLARAQLTPESRARLTDLTSDPKVRPATRAAVIAALDLEVPNHFDRAMWFLDEELRKKRGTDLAALCALALRLSEARKQPGYSGEHKTLDELMKRLPPEQATPFVKALGRLVMTSRVAKASDLHLDEWLFEFFIAQVQAAPSPDFLPELATIDVSHYPSSSQAGTESRVGLLAAGVAIADADPSSKDAVVRALARWASDEKLFNPRLVGGVVGGRESHAAKGKRWVKTLKRFKALAR